MEVVYKSIGLDFCTAPVIQQKLRQAAFDNVVVEFDVERWETVVKNLPLGANVNMMSQIITKIETKSVRGMDREVLKHRYRKSKERR